MNTPTDTAPGLFLYPGALAFGRSPLRLRTLLGSCVSVVVWHPGERVGGMCHYLLAERPAQASSAEADGRFASDALALLGAQMQLYGLPGNEYIAHLCGGANCFSEPLVRGTLPDIGQHNLNAAETWCQQRGLTVQQRHTGGISYRHVMFDVGSGTLNVRQGTAPDTQAPLFTP